ncbi:uncharacterized protein LOC115385720 isoform X3 [Salarias fasciatus]|uniref:uncharacterized protein LOC115385720 isoform X3 n=1 Tax=Salarias fasciatus TaxID=181472 RepID=UPI001176F1A2|nr:uncharacterized protein LOC115385720 isoform X3 [Salarias fasciatus]
MDAKPKSRATSTPDGGEQVTRGGEDNHGLKPLNPAVKVKVANSASFLDEEYHPLPGGPGTSTSTQGSGGVRPPALEPMPQPAPAYQSTPVDGRTQSAHICTSDMGLTSSAIRTRSICTASPELYPAPQWTTSTFSTWTTEDPAAATPLHTLPVKAEMDKSMTATTKPFLFARVLDWFQAIPAVQFEMATDKKNSNTTSSVPEAGGETIVRCRHAIQMEQQLRSVLDKKEEELRAARHEASEMKRHYEDQIGKLSSALQQKQEMQTIIERRQGNEQQFQARSVLDKQEEELRATRHEASEMKRNYEDQIGKLSSALHQKQLEMQTITERRQGNEQQFQSSYISRITSGLQTVFQHVMSPFSSAISGWFGTPDQDFRFTQMESYYKQELHKYNCALGERANEVEGYKQRMAERESYFQRKMDEKRSILQQREEELKSFKDRVAGEVALSIKTGKNESMNNPVSKTRLKEMYEDLRLQFLTIKNRLKSSNYRPDSVKASLQGIFTTAAENMEQKAKEIDQIFGLNEADSSPVSQKVNEYRKATVQYLQLTLYHNSKEEAESKMASLQNEESPEAVMELLTSHCQWLANLLALNDPPLQPDWENHDPGMNKWDILPRNLNSSSAL